MEISQATELIRTPLIESARPQAWCDLGCGSGSFTAALANLLAPASTIHAIDLDLRVLREIPEQYGDVGIRKLVGDIRNPNLSLPLADGILMANTLHFIPEQAELLKRLMRLTDRFLVVEYERSRPTPWGPYPVGFERLRQLFSQVGAARVEKVATHPSMFGGTLYSALATTIE
jgi:ubiquinone/menaquinone biosynthesis C-methylase UbiE